MTWKPERATEIVAGTPPGGGLDRSARALLRSIESNSLVDVSVSVVNVGGEGGRKAWSRVFDTALDAVADVVAGHADVGAITAASAVPELDAGRLITIGISAPTRLPGPYAGAPTWREQGVDCVVGSWRGVSGAPGLDAAQVAFWQGVLAAAT